MIVDALRKKYEYEILSARANIDVYLRNSAGIGEHPDIVAAVDTEMEKLAEDAFQEVLALVVETDA